MNQAQNVLTPKARMSVMRMRLIEKLEGIIRESVKPMKKIEGIKILQINGLVAAGKLGPTPAAQRIATWKRAQRAVRCYSSRTLYCEHWPARRVDAACWHGMPLPSYEYLLVVPHNLRR